MNKIFYLIPFALLACSGGCSTDKIPSAPISPVKEPDSHVFLDSGTDAASDFTFANAFFKFKLPSHWKQEDEKNQKADAYFSTPRDGGAAFLASIGDFTGSLDEFSLLSYRAAKESGMNIMSSLYQTINDQKYFQLLLSKESSLFWTWTTVKDKKALTFGCKTQNLPENLSAMVCEPIIRSVHLL